MEAGVDCAGTARPACHRRSHLPLDVGYSEIIVRSIQINEAT